MFLTPRNLNHLSKNEKISFIINYTRNWNVNIKNSLNLQSNKTKN